MKKTFALCCMLAAFSAYAQKSIGIGTNTPDSTAALDISSTGKGLLIPRIDSAARVNIANPPNGLMVFQKDGRKGFWYFVDGNWLYIPDKTGAGDNLGNHTAIQNLNLQNKLLVGSDTSTLGLRVNASGMVGIANTSPAQLLHLGSVNYPKPSFVRLEAGSSGGYRQWEMGIPVNAANPGDLSGENFDFAIRDATANATRMMIQWNNGFVGINTSAPTQRLEVNGTAKASFLESTAGANFGSGATGDGTIAKSLRLGHSTAGEGIVWKSTAGGNQYGIDLFTNGQSRLAVRNDGKIGISTTTPYSMLSNNPNNIIGSDGNGGNYYSLSWVGSQSGFIGQFYNASTGGAANGMEVKVASSTSTALDVSRGTSQTTAGTPLFTVKATGNVGIGTNTPTQALDVNGNTNVNGNITLTGTLSIGLQYVQDTAISYAHSYSTFTKACPANTKLISGGAGAIDITNSNQIDIRLIYSGPMLNNTNTWQLNCFNTNNADVPVRIYVICAKVQ